jgi:hypothetical protein
MKSNVPIPTSFHPDFMDFLESPETLCANFRRGCNAVTDGPIEGRLTYCEECASHRLLGAPILALEVAP